MIKKGFLSILAVVLMVSGVWATTTLTTPYSIPKPPLETTGTADGYGTLMDSAAANIAADVVLAKNIRPVATATGTDTITATYSPAITLTSGTKVVLYAAGANTGAATFAPNSLTVKAIKKYVSTALVAGDIPAAGYPCVLVYDGTNWILQNPSVETRLGGANAPSAAEISLVRAATASSFQSQLDTLATNYISKLNLTAKGDLLTSSAAGTPAVVADVAVGQVLTSGGVGEYPVYSATPLISPKTGTIAGTGGGTYYPSTDGTNTGTKVNFFTITALTGTAIFALPPGTWNQGDKLIIRVKSAAAQTLDFTTNSTVWRAGTDAALPTTTAGSSKTQYMLFLYNSTDSRFDYMAKADGF